MSPQNMDALAWKWRDIKHDLCFGFLFIVSDLDLEHRRLIFVLPWWTFTPNYLKISLLVYTYSGKNYIFRNSDLDQKPRRLHIPRSSCTNMSSLVKVHSAVAKLRSGQVLWKKTLFSVTVTFTLEVWFTSDTPSCYGHHMSQVVLKFSSIIMKYSLSNNCDQNSIFSNKQ